MLVKTWISNGLVFKWSVLNDTSYPMNSGANQQGDSFACMFDDYLWKSYVYQTTFSNVKYQDLCFPF